MPQHPDNHKRRSSGAYPNREEFAKLLKAGLCAVVVGNLASCSSDREGGQVLPAPPKIQYGNDSGSNMTKPDSPERDKEMIPLGGAVVIKKR